MSPGRGGRGSPASTGRVSELAAAVARRRRELGLLQGDVADLAGCSHRFVHTVEHGKESLRLDKLLDVLEVLGLDLSVGPGAGRVRDATASPAERRGE